MPYVDPTGATMSTSASSAISLIVKQQRQQQTSNILPKPTEQQAATKI